MWGTAGVDAGANSVPIVHPSSGKDNHNIRYHCYADDIQFKDSLTVFPNQLSDQHPAVANFNIVNVLQLNLDKTETLIVAPETQVPVIKHHLGTIP